MAPFRASLCVVFLVGCQGAADAPVVEVVPPSSGAPDSPAAWSTAAPSVAASSAPPAEPSAPTGPPAPWCLGRGLRPLNPCPGGGEADLAELSLPETLGMCCAEGPVDGVEGQACFAAVEAAETCHDPAGKRAALARMQAFARKFGEFCENPVSRRVMYGINFKHARICRERGFFVPTAVQLPPPGPRWW